MSHEKLLYGVDYNTPKKRELVAKFKLWFGTEHLDEMFDTGFEYEYTKDSKFVYVYKVS